MKYEFTFKTVVEAEMFSYYISKCKNAELAENAYTYDPMLDIWTVEVILTCEHCIGGSCK